MRTTVRLIQVIPEIKITKNAHPDFFFELQNALLLCLKEDSLLTQTEYQQAAEILKKQWIDALHSKITEGCDF